jgi:hypothetical protein
VVSEPLTPDRSLWTAVPPNHMLIAKARQAPEIVPIDIALRVAAE